MFVVCSDNALEDDATDDDDTDSATSISSGASMKAYTVSVFIFITAALAIKL